MKAKKLKRFKRSKAVGFFDQDFRLSKLTKLGDPLERLIQGVDFEMFRPLLENRLHVEPKYKGGRPPFDYILMFKILILQRYYNLSNDQTEYQICDRLSFMRFLGLTLADDVPDSNTIWNFRERLVDLGLVEELFMLFVKKLETLSLIVNEGKIVDASFVDVPRQRNSREENKEVKSGETPEDWKDKPHKLCQKDLDARWTKKNNEKHYGYKNHAKCDSESKIITKYAVTHAAVHDSKPFLDLIDEKDEGQPMFADSAYVGTETHKVLTKDKKVIPNICEKGYKNNPLTDQQKQTNKEKSKTRVRVEHIFGFMENSMNGSFIRTIGFQRAQATIGLMNLTYNLFRKLQIA